MIKPTRRLIIIALIAINGFILAGCSASDKGDATALKDPYESLNRKVFYINLKLDDYILEPAAKGYLKLPSPVRTAITNQVQWISHPSTAVNSALQGKFENGALAVVHFLMNGLTLGLADIIPSDDEPLTEDFGQTLASWNMPQGPYFMLPILGPGTIRSHSARIVDGIINPLGYTEEPVIHTVSSITPVTGAVSFRGNNFDQFNEVKYNAIDPYARTRSFYHQYRTQQINDGKRGENSEADEAFGQFEDEEYN